MTKKDRRKIRMNNPDNSQSKSRRKRLNENVNRKLQHPDPNDPMDNDKEAHALSSKGHEEQLEAPTKKIKASKQHAHEANAKQEKDDLNVMKAIGSDESEHIINIENDHDSPSIMRDEQDLQDHLINSDVNIKTKAMALKPVTNESTTDIEMKSPDISNGSLSKSSISSTAAEANKQSGMSNNTSDDRLKKNKGKTPKQAKKKKHHSAAETRGYNGLRNQGATCYLNAVLQTLFMTEEFRKAVTELNEENLNEKCVSFELKELFNKLKSNKGSVSTHEITTALDIRNVCEQQDAAEYYQKILSMMEPKPAKIFQGTKKHSTTCMHGNHESIDEINSFFSLAISMDSDQCQINVTESFNAQFEVMLMDGEDQLFCVNCNTMTDMEMKCSIPELPKVLTLHLKRFYLDYNYMTYKKNNRRVQIPLRLSAQEASGVKHDYDLYALVHHSGSLSGGHYYADIKSFEDQHWYTFNDSSVYRIAGSQIQKLDDDRNLQNHFVSDTACLLFFRKSRDDEDQQNQTNISDFNSKIEGKPSQTLTDDPSADTGTQSTDAEHLSNDPSSHDCRHTEHTDNPDESDQDPPSTARDDEDQQNQRNISDLNSETEGKSSQTLTDDPSADTGTQSTDAEYLSNAPQHIHINDETHRDSPSTARDVEDQQHHMDISDFNSETEGKPSQTLTDEPTADTGTQSTDAEHLSNDPSSHDYSHTAHTDNPDENDQDPPSTARDDEGQQNQTNISDFDSETEGKPSQTLTDEPTADTGTQSTDGDINLPNVPEHIIINIEDDHDSPTARDDEDQENQMNNSDFNSKDETAAETQSNDSDSDVRVHMELEPLNEDKTQSHTNNNKTRRSCCIKCCIL